jgi:regulatory protein
MVAGSAQGRSANVATDPEERAREIALRILAGAPRSAAQLREALLAREVIEPIVDEVIARYREVGLIDDAGLAQMIARTRHLERGQSRRAIAQELRRKGFEPEDVSSALAQVSDDDERDAAQALAERRWSALAGVPRDTRVRRVVALLGRKGYAPGVAFDLVRRLERADIWEDREVKPAEEDVT